MAPAETDAERFVTLLRQGTITSMRASTRLVSRAIALPPETQRAKTRAIPGSKPRRRPRVAGQTALSLLGSHEFARDSIT
jgi:hypothetical protein